VKLLAGAAPAAFLPRAFAAATNAPANPSAALPAHLIAPGPFQPSWESLVAQYKCPEWFRDAKFGIWAHWTAQCVPEQGDWYARQMYLQGHHHYDHHLKNYGHPSKLGFMEIDNLWKVDKWEPDKLIALYKRAGAKYFFALANHHDNFDAYNSQHHAWNSINVGPKQDLVGGWAKAARQAGLRFGVSNHSAHSWHWFQTAYDYDPEGPLAGVRYDAYTLTKADGKGKWWEGLDPQELYNGRNIVMPDGLTTIKEANQFHRRDGEWDENPPPHNPAFTERWFLRCKDLIDQYHPDVLYFDNRGLPLGQAGLDIAAHYYNAAIQRSGSLDVVLNCKRLPAEHRPGVVEDIERGVAGEIRPAPWQTDTCIGSWHYERRLFDEHKYKTSLQVVQMLVDIVSKNGNLMLSVPVRGDGTIDSDEVACLEGVASWMAANGEGIFATRPWEVYGEGPSVRTQGPQGQFGGSRDVRSYTAEDIRFTSKGGLLYAFVLAWPQGGKVTIKSLARGSSTYPKDVARVELLGNNGPLAFDRDATGLVVTLPQNKPNDYAYALKIMPA